MAEVYEDILYEVSDALARITLNRPARLNAWTAAMERGIKASHTSWRSDRRASPEACWGCSR